MRGVGSGRVKRGEKCEFSKESIQRVNVEGGREK